MAAGIDLVGAGRQRLLGDLLWRDSFWHCARRCPPTRVSAVISGWYGRLLPDVSQPIDLARLAGARGPDGLGGAGDVAHGPRLNDKNISARSATSPKRERRVAFLRSRIPRLRFGLVVLRVLKRASPAARYAVTDLWGMRAFLVAGGVAIDGGPDLASLGGFRRAPARPV